MTHDGCTHRRPLDLAKVHHQRLDVRWRSPLAKALVPDPEFQWLHDIADKAQPEVRAAFLEAIRRLRGTVKEAELRAAIETGNVREVLRVLDLDKTISEVMGQALAPPLEDAFIEAGRGSIPATLPPSAGGGAGITMRFDLANPQTSRVLANYNFGLIRQISDDTRAAIQRVVTDAFAFGGHPEEQARQIRASIGLTDGQAEAVSNFRTMLETGDRSALDRTLRDRRFDPTLDAALGEDAEKELTPEQINRMVDRYRERTINLRAKTIARTTTIDISNTANQAAWGQAADQGLLDRSKTRQGWLVTPDDRLCLNCLEVPLLNPEGVPLGGYFQTPLGPVTGPTLHPNCRCVTYLIPSSLF